MCQVRRIMKTWRRDLVCFFVSAGVFSKRSKRKWRKVRSNERELARSLRFVQNEPRRSCLRVAPRCSAMLPDSLSHLIVAHRGLKTGSR